MKKINKIKFLYITCLLAVFFQLQPAEAVRGYIYSRAFVESEGGNKYWAEYNPETGELEGQPFEATGTLAETQVVVISAVTYNSYIDTYESLKQQYEDLHNDPNTDAPVPEVVTRDEFDGLTFETLSAQPQPINYPESLIYESTTHLVLRPPSLKDNNTWRYASSDPTLIVLAQMPIDPETTINDSTLSLLVSRESGEIERETENNIGFYTNYFGDVNEYDPTSDEWNRWLRDQDDKIWGPISDVPLSMPIMWGEESHGVSNQEGYYTIPEGRGPACFIMTDLSTGVVAQLQSKNFNPRSWNGFYPYYVRKPYYIPCDPSVLPGFFGVSGLSGQTGGSLTAPLAAASTIAVPAVYSLDFIIDMMILSGKATVKNEMVTYDGTDRYDPKPIYGVNITGDQIRAEVEDWTRDIEMTGSTETVYAETEFEFKDSKEDPAGSEPYKQERRSNFDLDQDGIPDISLRVHYVCVYIEPSTQEETLTPTERNATCPMDETKRATWIDVDQRPESEQFQGVFLSSTHPYGPIDMSDEPDIVRVLDYKHNRAHEGLLKSLSLEDLRNTDIYVFRESTGQLVAERSGLAQEETERYIKNIGVEEDPDNPDAEPFFFYRTQLRGRDEGKFRISSEFSNYYGDSPDEKFKRWQITSGMNPDFHEREADHIRSGEPLRIFAINRATGYVGSVKTVAQHSEGLELGHLSWIIPDIVMGPPNLRIWAERDYVVEEGLTSGEERSYLIGNEGGGMSDDITVRIYTEWYDQDGTPLPDDMEEFGFTGRIGKLTGPDTVGAAGIDSEDEEGDALAQFPVKPGRHIQLIRVSEENIGTQHLYVQVNGEPFIRSPNFSGEPNIEFEKNQERDADAPDGPDFDTLGAGEGALQYRPKHYVPFLAPLWNEEASLQAQLSYNAFMRSGQAGGQEPPLKPEPIFDWRYRPEFQFSVYDLEVSAIERWRSPNDDELLMLDPVDLLEEETPIISSSDQLISFIYDLADQVGDPLELFNAEKKELILAVGEEEFVLSFDNDTVEIENLEQLAYLSASDYLTMRLYNNSDADNILWEYAFELEKVFHLSRTESIGQFNDEVPTTTDSYRTFTFNITEPTDFKVDLLDHNRGVVDTLIDESDLEAGNYAYTVVYEDVAPSVLFQPGIDFYLRETYDVDGDISERNFTGYIRNQTESADLGHVIEHDTLIHRGALTLRREDMQLKGAGPQLSFTRSYSNENKVVNEVTDLGPGWTHSHNIFMQITNGSDADVDNHNIPVWVFNHRGPANPELFDPADIPEDNLVPKIVSVTSGGMFLNFNSTWYNQRGYHGRISFPGGAEPGSEVVFRSKDGTQYFFILPNFLEPEDGYRGSLPKAYINRIVDRNGNTLTYEYDPEELPGTVKRITDDSGRYMEFLYEEVGDSEVGLVRRLVSVRSSVGIDLDFDYYDNHDDPEFGVLREFSRDNFVEKYEYELADGDDEVNLVSVYDPNNHVTHYEYHTSGIPENVDTMVQGTNHWDYVADVTYPDGEAANISYDFSGSKRTVTDLRGNDTVYTLNSFGSPIEIVEPMGRTTMMVWSIDLGEDDNLLRKKTDGIGRNWEYQYDTLGNVIVETDPNGNTISQTWNQEFSLLESRTDQNSITVSYGYDGNGNLVSEIDGDGKNTSHSVDGRGLRTSTTFPNGNTYGYGYDGYGNLDGETRPGTSINYTNDNRGNRLTMTDGNGNGFSWSYDSLDRVVQHADPDGSHSYDYDAKGNKTSESQPNSLSFSYQYDARDRVETVIRSGNGASGSMSYSYDANSNIESETDWKGVATTHEYDDLNRLTDTTNRLGDSMSYTYDLADRKLSETDYESNATSYTYDNLDNVLTVTNAHGDTMSYTYDNTNNILSETDYESNTTSYTYNGRYLRESRTNALSDTASWTYDNNGNALSFTDEEGRTDTYTYDGQNRKLTETLAGTINRSWTYDANGNPLTYTNGRNLTTTYTYEGMDRVETERDPDGYTQSYAYDAGGNVTVYTDGRGNNINSNYDSLNRKLSETISSIGATTAWLYDENDNIVQVTDPKGNVTSRTYDALDRMTNESQGSGVRSQSWTYDNMGNALTHTDFRNNTSRYEYDNLYRQTASVTSLGHRVETTYDNVGNVLSIKDPKGNSVTNIFDDLYRIVTIRDVLNQTITNTWDGVGNLLTINDKRNILTTNTYDSLYRNIQSVRGGIRLFTNEFDGENNVTAITDANNHRYEYDYDGRNNRTVTTNPDGTTIVYVYDGASNITSETDEISQVTTNTYDGANRLITSSNYANEVTSFTYDLNSNQIQVTKPKGNITTLDYDTLDRLVSVTDPVATTSYSYDGNNNLLTQQDGNGNLVSYVYDDDNRRIEHRQPQGLITYMRYDKNNNLVGITDPEGQIFSFEYDGLNRRVRSIFDTINTATYKPVDTLYTYDGNNNLLALTENKLGLQGAFTDLSTFTYDTLDRMLTNNQRGHAVSYTYDNNGNRTSHSAPGGSTTYVYDSRNRLIESHSTQGISYWAYTDDSKLDTVTYPNGTETLYTYDDADRMLTVTNQQQGGASLISSYQYTYDANGNRTSQIETQNGFTIDQLETTDYTFDTADRLKTIAISRLDGYQHVSSYDYDANYNRTHETIIETIGGIDSILKNRTLHYNDLNWLTHIEEDDNSDRIDYIYDNNGNTLSKTTNTAGVIEEIYFEYNSQNQLTETIRGPPGSATSLGQYDYNYDGMRVRHLNSERGNIEYIYDGKTILEERDLDSSGLLAHYRYGDRLISLETPIDEQFYHYSALRTTTNLTDNTGATKVSYRSDAWGHITNQEGESVNRQVFTGQEHDEQTGLIYFGARYYDPDTGRFITQDSYLGEPNTPPSLHRYLYAYNNPTVYMDLYGYKCYSDVSSGCGNEQNHYEPHKKQVEEANAPKDERSGYERSRDHWCESNGVENCTNAAYDEHLGQKAAKKDREGLTTEAKPGEGQKTCDAGPTVCEELARREERHKNNVSAPLEDMGETADTVISFTPPGMVKDAVEMWDEKDDIVQAVKDNKEVVAVGSAAAACLAVPKCRNYVKSLGGNSWEKMKDAAAKNKKNDKNDRANHSQGETDDFYQTTPDGDYYWPENLGFADDPIENTLPEGTVLDRFGDNSGAFMSPEGVPFDQRALGPGDGIREYRQYEVIKPLPVLEGEIAPAFGKPGGGTQYLPNFDNRVNIEWLIDEGYLREL